jgi:hypothetical protein
MNHYPISAPHGHETPNHTPGCMCECCWGNVVEAEAREARETGFGAEGEKSCLALVQTLQALGYKIGCRCADDEFCTCGHLPDCHISQAFKAEHKGFQDLFCDMDCKCKGYICSKCGGN